MKNLLLAVVLAFSLPVLASDDPYESFNRKAFAFNDGLDRAVLKPVAEGYVNAVPAPARRSVSNFFSNLGEVSNTVNSLLQGKPDQAATSLGRFIFNSTLGIGGLFDPMSGLGLEETPEDFGQTLATWGWSDSNYLVLPLFGPSTVRDGVGRFSLDYQVDPVSHLSPESHGYWLRGLGLVETRAGLLGTDALLAQDPYVVMRDAYLQRRDFLIRDGQVSDDFLEDF